MKNQTEQGTIRITKWDNTSIRIVDCEFAGKRGKVCQSITIQISANSAGNYQHQGQAFCDIENNMKSKLWGAFPLSGVNSFKDALNFAELAECQDLENAFVRIYMSEEKAVRVQPLGFEEITVSNDNFAGTFEYESFCVSDLVDRANEPRWIDCHRTAKASFKKVYAFVKENQEMLTRPEVTFSQFINMVSEATGVRGHQYCAMD